MYKCARIVLVSGGIDSTLCSLLAERDGGPFTALAVDYGQNRHELAAVDFLNSHYRWGRYVKAQITPFPSSDDGSRTNFMPGRNAMFLSLAAAMLAESGGQIYIGSNADDHADYPDCREEFFRAFEAMQRAQGRNIQIIRPLINLTKAMVMKEAKQRGIPIDKTVSCYINAGCGECNACKLRASAEAVA